MSNSVQISKIDIKIGDKTLSLSLEEAKELKDRLSEFFPDNITIQPYWPVYIPYSYTETPDPFPSKWEFTCGDSSNTCFTCKT